MAMLRLLLGRRQGELVERQERIMAGWQRLTAEYAKQFGMEAPNWPSQTAQKS